MADHPGVNDLLRQAQVTSRAQKRRNLPKRDYTAKEHFLAQAVRLFRQELWIGLDRENPTLLIIAGPPFPDGRRIVLHLPLKKAKRLKLTAIIGRYDDESLRPR